MSITKQNSYKITIIGDSSVGKTCIVNTLMNNEPHITSVPTIGLAFYTKKYDRNPPTRLEIWDTAGQERFRAMTPVYFRGSDGCIIIFDVMSRESFENVKYWIDEYKKHSLSNGVIIIVANKIDNAVDMWQVNISEINNLSTEYGAHVHYTTIMKPETIEKLFSDMMNKLIQNRSDFNKYQLDYIRIQENSDNILIQSESRNCYC